MIIKILMSLLIILLCGYIGHGLSNYYKSRLNFFSDAKERFTLAKNEVLFQQLKMRQVFENIAKTDNADLKKIANNYISYLNSNNSQLKESDIFASIHILKKEEKASIFNFLNSIGRSDCAAEEKLFTNYITIFENSESASRKIYDKYGHILTKLGLLFGCAIALITF